MPAISTGLAIGLGVAGAAAGGIAGAVGASSAAGAQAGAANNAANLQYQLGQQSLAFQKQQLATQQANIAPWLQTGAGALGQLSNLLGITPNTSIGGAPGGTPTINASGLPGQQTMPFGGGQAGGGAMPLSMLRFAGEGARILPTNPLRGGSENGVVPVGPGQNILPGQAPSGGPGTPGFGSLMQPYGEQFQAPTNVTEQNDPGYKFRLDQGMQALQNSAAARGGLLSGGTAKDLENYAQNYASNEYSNVYGRSLGEYQQRYNIFQQNQANQFNRLSALAGTGQTAAGQLGSLGQSAAGNVNNILMGTGSQVGQSLTNAGAARASGYAGGANAIGGALSGGTNSIFQGLLLSKLLGGGGLSIPDLNTSSGV